MFETEIRDCPELTCGESVNGWLAEVLIGEGGFGKVFRVRKGRLKGALKIYSPYENQVDSGDERWRFQQEIALLKAIKGRFAPSLYESGVHRGTPYFVMELLTPLKPRTMPKSDEDIKQMMLDLTEAVDELHKMRVPGYEASGWIHCDIKPYNIGRLNSGRYALIDFGSAHERDPEGVERHQIRENTLNARNGVYRICATKYYNPPDLNFSPARDIYAIGHLLRDCFKRDVPLEWSLIINKCISWQPRYRYQTASELWNDVNDIDKIKRKMYWGLRKKKIEEQREAERSLANAKRKIVEWEEILSVDNKLTTPDLTVMRIDLKRDQATCFVVIEPLALAENTVLMISGRGVLRADISGPSSSIVVLRGYTSLNNTNVKLPPKNELLYAIIGPGAYLNFPYIKEKDRRRFFPDNGKRRIFRDMDATTAFRFNGPDTFFGVVQQTVEGLEKSDLPQRYRDQLIEFFKGESFSVTPKNQG